MSILKMSLRWTKSTIISWAGSNVFFVFFDEVLFCSVDGVYDKVSEDHLYPTPGGTGGEKYC